MPWGLLLVYGIRGAVADTEGAGGSIPPLPFSCVKLIIDGK